MLGVWLWLWLFIDEFSNSIFEVLPYIGSYLIDNYGVSFDLSIFFIDVFGGMGTSGTAWLYVGVVFG